MILENVKKKDLEYNRVESRNFFENWRDTWINCGQWALPYRTKWLLSQTKGNRTNYHITDTTHVIALRSFVAGFMEGNTSSSRPWFRVETGDRETNLNPENKEWLDTLTRLCFKQLSNSNFYDAAGYFYYDYGVFNTGTYYIEEMPNGRLHFHVLEPGSYYVVDDGYGKAIQLIREYRMSVKALVDTYGRKVNGEFDWSNFSGRVRTQYKDGNYTYPVDIVHVVKLNDDYDSSLTEAGNNRKWISLTYEIGSNEAPPSQDKSGPFSGSATFDPLDEHKFLRVTYHARKPFVVGKSTMQSEYGEKGPTLDALGAIKSLNKKAIARDQAIEQILKPVMVGPGTLRKSYLSMRPGSFISEDLISGNQKGFRRAFDASPAVNVLNVDVQDLRKEVSDHYFEDLLRFLSLNPKTRTATETAEVVQERQRIIGPSLSSLNWSHNVPLVEYVMAYVIENDPFLPPPPEELEGQFLRPEMISVFAQAQRAADLPNIDQYVQRMLNVGQIDPSALDKLNLDRLADIYEDRYYLPAGLNRDQASVEAIREQRQAQQARAQQVQEAVALSQAQRNVNSGQQTGGE